MAEITIDGKEERDEIRGRTAPVCSLCANWHIGTDHCRAFPDEIPDEIFLQGNPHRRHVPGDHGIQFEAIEE